MRFGSRGLGIHAGLKKVRMEMKQSPPYRLIGGWNNGGTVIYKVVMAGRGVSRVSKFQVAFRETRPCGMLDRAVSSAELWKLVAGCSRGNR